VHDARPTIADLRELIRRPGPNNDLIELTAKQPRLAELTATCSRARSGRSTAPSRWSSTRAATPRPHRLAHEVRPGRAYYDANGHYARVMPVFSPTQLDRVQNKLAASRRSSASPGSSAAAPNLPRRRHAAAARRLSPWPFRGCDHSGPPSRPARLMRGSSTSA
jgi:phospholipid/cholesterol/gamma-HCH transport system substrate-binding protein